MTCLKCDIDKTRGIINYVISDIQLYNIFVKYKYNYDKYFFIIVCSELFMNL